MKIEIEQWYSISELMVLAKDGVVPYRSRTTWLDLIKRKVIPHLIKGDTNRRIYMLQGKDILDYLNANKVPKN